MPWICNNHGGNGAGTKCTEMDAECDFSARFVHGSPRGTPVPADWILLGNNGTFDVYGYQNDDNTPEDDD